MREKRLDGIRRIAEAQARSAGLPDDLMPEVRIESDCTPSTYNDPELTERVMGGEDFSQFSRTVEDIPALIYWTGGADPDAMRAACEGRARSPPANHSPFFASMPEPTLKTGVQAMTGGALELLGR